MGGLEKTIEKMEMAIKKDNYEKLGPLNKEFHMRIYQGSPTPYLLNLIVELWERVHRLESVFVLIPNRALESFEEHKKMLEAAKERNGEVLAKYVRLQKRNSMKAMVQYAEKNGESVDDLFLKYL
jgi:GntR family transcriptional regulator, transcriptional repressor for pyruvate dehydrogenase complex